MNDTKGCFEGLRRVTAKVLLLGGGKSPSYLKSALDTLEEILPIVRRIEFPRLGHSGPDNSGKPELIDQELRNFFGNSNHA